MTGPHWLPLLHTLLGRVRWRGRIQFADALAAGASLLILSAVGYLPLFGEPGYEFALAAGLVLPAAMALATALTTATSRRSPLDTLLGALLAAAFVSLLGVGVSLAHGVRGTLCDPWRGLAIYALGGGAGALMGAHWGFWVGLVCGRSGVRRPRLWSVVFALAGPVAGVVLSLWRFFSSPMVFAFDPFFGHFAGPLYDTVVDPVEALASYRVGSLFTLLAGVIVSSGFDRGSDGRLSWRIRPLHLPFLAASLLMSVGLSWVGPEFGHFSTTSSIREQLSAVTRSGHCVVVHRPHQPARDMALLARDCDATLARLEDWFGLSPDPHDVTVYLYSSPGDKGRLMGASRTYVAKPWRREIYLNAQSFPHPVLPHELAHVVAGRFGQGPLHIAGSFWGILPDPGRIEGFAEAAAPDTDTALSLEESARAMLALKILPRLDELFALSFLRYNASTGYTAAGAFVTWLREEFGTAALRAWYSGRSLEETTGASLRALEQRWHQHLSARKLSAAELGAARDVFQRPAIFGRRCPRVVDRLKGEAARQLAEGAISDAEARYEQVRRADEHSLAAQLGLAACAMRGKRFDQADKLYKKLLGTPRLTELERAAVQEALGDLWLAQGKYDVARNQYRAAAKAQVDEGALRSLEVKAQAESTAARRGLVALLMGDRSGQGWPEAVEALLTWSQSAPDQALPEYLLGKNWFTQGKYELAALHLDAALERGGLPNLAQREALRVQKLTACALGDWKLFEDLTRRNPHVSKSEADDLAQRELEARCRGVLGRR